MSDRICSDDPSLPDDLAEVAAQLTDDAEHLAKTYPAGQPDLWEAEIVRSGGLLRHPRTSTWLRGMAAAAAILVIVPTTWYASGLPWFGSDATQETFNTGIHSNSTLPADVVLHPNAVMPALDPGGQPMDPHAKQPTHVVIPVKSWEKYEIFIQDLRRRLINQLQIIKALQEENAQLKARLEKQIE
ncbi:MAG: hypothetical protein JW829_08860 [Pirellulales bacterium]|nr:hypothetical protein [Pirellulales bacterium]